MPNHTSKMSKAAERIELPVKVQTAYGEATIKMQDRLTGDPIVYVVRSPEAPPASFWKKEAAWLCLLTRLADLQNRTGVAADPDF